MQPLGKVVMVCDDVVADPVSHKASILNVWEVVRVPEDECFPYTLPKIVLVAMLRDGQGSVTFQAVIRRAGSGESIRQSAGHPLRFDHPRQTRLLVLRMPNVTFPVPGEYLVELYCDGLFIDDQSITLLPT